MYVLGNSAVSVEIHARTNALGLPFLASGRIVGKLRFCTVKKLNFFIWNTIIKLSEVNIF